MRNQGRGNFSIRNIWISYFLQTVVAKLFMVTNFEVGGYIAQRWGKEPKVEMGKRPGVSLQLDSTYQSWYFTL